MDFMVPQYSALAVIAATLLGFIVGRLTARWSTQQSRRQKPDDTISVEEDTRKLPPALAAAVRSDLAAGNTLQAVNRVHEALRCDLNEARNIVEHINS